MPESVPSPTENLGASESDALVTQLLQHQELFLAFARKRLADPELAADALQESLFKALRRKSQVRSQESAVPWFYRILRRTIVDLYRRRGVRQNVIVPMPDDLDPAAPLEEATNLCVCLRPLLPTLKPEYAQALDLVDLKETPLADAAAHLGIAPNNLKVRLHRARRQLRDRLLQTCGLCARHRCLDCDCK